MGTSETLPANPTEHRAAEDGRGAPLPLLVWFSIAIAAYVLSTGPVIKLANRASGRPSTTVMAAYYPLIALSDHSTIVNKFFNWYVVDLWHAK